MSLEMFIKGVVAGTLIVLLIYAVRISARVQGRRKRVPYYKVLLERLEDQSQNVLRLTDPPADQHCAEHPSSVWLDIQLTEHSGTTMCLGCLEDLSIAAQVVMRRATTSQ